MNLFSIKYCDLTINEKINCKSWNTKPDKKYDVFFTINNVVKGFFTQQITIEDRQIKEVNPFKKYCRND
jgi:hypothetical protein